MILGRNSGPVAIGGRIIGLGCVGWEHCHGARNNRFRVIRIWAWVDDSTRLLLVVVGLSSFL